MAVNVPQIISVEEYLEYYGETLQTYRYKEQDILGCIRYTTLQLDAICENLFKCWEETDQKSIYYRKQEEKENIQKAFFIQVKYNLDNGNDLKQNSNYNYSSGSVNFSESKRQREEILMSVIDLLQKARVYRSIKNISCHNGKDMPKSLNKIIEILLEVCDRRYINKDFNNETHSIITYKNKHFDVLPIVDLAKYIDNQLYTELQNIKNFLLVLQQNYVELEFRVKALEDIVNNVSEETRASLDIEMKKEKKPPKEEDDDMPNALSSKDFD